MAIEITSISKPVGGVCVVVVQDTGNQIGTDESSQPIYKTYSVRHNINLDASALKAKIEKLISADQKAASDAETVTTAIRTTVESIDTSKLSATKEV